MTRDLFILKLIDRLTESNKCYVHWNYCEKLQRLIKHSKSFPEQSIQLKFLV